MECIFISVLVLCGIAILAAWWMLWRNNLVYAQFVRAADIIHEIDRREINAGGDYDPWRWKELSRIDYETVLFAIHRSPHSFFEGQAFLNPDAQPSHKLA